MGQPRDSREHGGTAPGHGAGVGRRRHRLIALCLPLLAVVALALGACGDDDDSGEGAAAPAKTATSGACPSGSELRIALDFTPNTNHSGIYIAQARDWFADRGVDAKVIPYSGTGGGVLVESGQADLAVDYPPSLLIQASQGMDLVAVGELIQVSNGAIVVKEDAKVTDPAELAGKAYGGYGTPHEKAVIGEIIKQAGAEDPSFKEVVLKTGAIEALTADRVDFSSVFEGWSEIGAKIAGTPVRSFPYKDYVDGFNYPDVIFITSRKTLEAKGDVVRCGLAALAKGYEFAAEDPKAAADILLEQVPDLAPSAELVRESADFRAPQYLDESGTWGCLREEQFAGLSDVLATNKVIPEPLALDDYATNEYLEGCS